MTLKPFETYLAHIIRIDRNNGKIVEFRVFNDSASLAQTVSLKSPYCYLIIRDMLIFGRKSFFF